MTTGSKVAFMAIALGCWLIFVALLLSGCSSIMRCNENAARYTTETITDGLGIKVHTREEWQCMPAPQPQKEPAK